MTEPKHIVFTKSKRFLSCNILDCRNNYDRLGFDDPKHPDLKKPDSEKEIYGMCGNGRNIVKENSECMYGILNPEINQGLKVKVFPSIEAFEKHKSLESLKKQDPPKRCTHHSCFDMDY